MPTSAEIMGSIAAMLPPRWDPKKRLSSATLQLEFADAWRAQWPVETPPAAPTGSKRALQLKGLIAFARTEGISDADLVKAVRKAVSDWSGFTAYVAARSGLKLKEDRPNHSALASQRDKLVNFYRAPVQVLASDDPAPGFPQLDPPGLKPIKKG